MRELSWTHDAPTDFLLSVLCSVISDRQQVLWTDSVDLDEYETA